MSTIASNHVGCRRCSCGRTITPTETGKRCGRCVVHGKLRRERIKNAAFEAYGGYRCSCCGQTMKLALQIDHVNNDGADHRTGGCGTGERFYRWLKTSGYPPGFAILCACCNVAKHLNKGICPHQETPIYEG